MNQNDKSAMLAKIEGINRVEGFDPAPFAVEYTDLTTGEVRKRLPVMIQMAWFRLKYPEGRIAIQVTAAKDCFVATAKVYPSYKDPTDAYLSEATASRSFCEDKPSISPREWAQTAAVGIALRNAGFGLQFSMAGEEPEPVAGAPDKATPKTGAASPQPVHEPEDYIIDEPAPAPRELTPEEKLAQAMQVMCPIAKFRGKTLGEMLRLDPGAIKWLATKFTGGEEITSAARLICEYAMQQAVA